MRSSIAAVIGLVLLSVSSVAQPALSKPATARRIAPHKPSAEEQQSHYDQLGLDLLKKSHGLNEQLSDQQRFTLLTGQIQTANRYDKTLGNEWAHELFELGKQGRVRSPGMVQLIAINSIAGSDPEEALKMLSDVDPEAIAPRDDEYPGATIATKLPRNLFVTMARNHGKKSLPKIFEIADSLGARGRYPYSAVMAAALEVKDDAVVESTARRLLTRYQQRLDSPLISFDFVDMLNSSENHWPKDLLKPAIEAAVDGLEQYPVNDDNKEYEATYTTKEKSSTAHGPVEIGLLRIAWLIKRDEPELWTKLLKGHPNLETFPFEGFGKGAHTMTLRLSRGEPSGPPTAEDVKYDVMDEIRRLIPDDPDKAMAVINSIPDAETKAEGLSMASQMLADANKPQQAAEFAAQAQQIVDKIKAPELRFRAACARLQADAGNKNRSALPQELDDVFQLAEKLIREAREEKKDTFDIIEPLSHTLSIVMWVEPELTVAHIEQISLPFEKANLLSGAAAWLVPLATSRKTTSDKPESAQSPAN